MELKQAIEILEYHQEWRLGKKEDMIHEPKKLTEALDRVISECKRRQHRLNGEKVLNALNVLASLSHEERKNIFNL